MAVYFILEPMGGFIKIGHTQKVHERFIWINGSSPYPLTLLGSVPGKRDAEKYLHCRFNHLKHRNEWFRAEPELTDYVRSVIAHGGLLGSPDPFEMPWLVADTFKPRLRQLLAEHGITAEMLARETGRAIGTIKQWLVNLPSTHAGMIVSVFGKYGVTLAPADLFIKKEAA